MSEDDPEERETRQKTWLVENAASLENENGELEKALREMETRLSIQEARTMQVEERCMRLETAITRVAEVVEQQNANIESSKALLNNIVEEFKIHHDRIQKMAMVMQVHELHIVRSGAVTQEMAQYINALILEN